MSAEVLPSGMLSESSTRLTEKSEPEKFKPEVADSCRTPSEAALVSDERVQKTTGVQFPFLADFFRRNLEGSRPSLERNDSLNSVDTHINRQKSVDSADHQVGRGLRVLDLRALPRDDGPPTELQARREKFVFFEKKCSEVVKGVCVAGELVARDRALLQESGITHIVNCIGMLCPPCFPADFTYLTLYLYDATGEDLMSLLYEVFAFIEDAVESGGKVLVHCSQGVSRSATFVIAYLIWKNNWSYDKAYHTVKAIRGVANPNIGFTCQLLQWIKRRGAPAAGYKAFQIMPHSSDEKLPHLLVARLLRGEVAVTDSERVLILCLPAGLYIWQGSQSKKEHVLAAWKAAAKLQRFEGLPAAELVQQGQEPAILCKALGLQSEARQLEHPPHSDRPKPFVPRVRLPSTGGAPATGDSSAPNSARTKTPRTEGIPAGLRSPNQRQRKVRRSDSTSEGPATARSRSSESIEEIDEGALEPSAPMPELSRTFSPQKRTPRSSRSTHSPVAPRSPLAPGSLKQSPQRGMFQGS